MVNKTNFVSLKLGRDFSNLKKKGRRVYPCKWIIFSFLGNDQKGLRVGYTISKKVGGAVVRNRLKRWGREFFRHCDNKNSVNLDLNIVIRQVNYDFFKQLTHEEFDSVMQKGWRNLLKSL